MIASSQPKGDRGSGETPRPGLDPSRTRQHTKPGNTPNPAAPHRGSLPRTVAAMPVI
jgi:hypothetical protein